MEDLDTTVEALAKYILESIVGNPKDVVIDVTEEASEDPTEDPIVKVHLKVNEEDKGLVIGREGRTINAIRTLLAIKARAKVLLKVE